MKRINYQWKLKDNDELVKGNGVYFTLNEDEAAEEVARNLSRAWPEALDIEVRIVPLNLRQKPVS